MTKQSVFTGKEQAQILTALVQLANQCPELPCKVYLDTLSEKAPAMCLGTMTGGSKVYNVVGGYTENFGTVYFEKNQCCGSAGETWRFF